MARVDLLSQPPPLPFLETLTYLTSCLFHTFLEQIRILSFSATRTPLGLEPASSPSLLPRPNVFFVLFSPLSFFLLSPLSSSRYPNVEEGKLTVYLRRREVK